MAGNSKNAIVKINGKLVLSDYVYSSYKNQKHANNNIDVFSLLGILTENADIFLPTNEKTKYKAMIKYMYTQSEIKTLLEENNLKNLNALVEKIIKIQGEPQVSENLKPVLDNLLKMQEYVSVVISDKSKASELTPPGRAHKEPLRLLKTGSRGFVDNLLRINDARDLIDMKLMKKVEIAELKIDENKLPTSRAKVIYTSVVNHIKKVYGYRAKATIGGEQEHANGKLLTCKLDKNPVSNAVDILYNVTKQMHGCKNISFAGAKKYLGNGVNVKELEKAFNDKKEAISETVAIISTIFAARFAFKQDVYYLINRQLSVQLAHRMRTLVFTTDGTNESDPCVKDAWLIKYIKEKVMSNVTNIVTKNKIHTAQQLANVYAENGTKIALPNDISTIEDLVFSLQFNSPEKQLQQQLNNAVENKVQPMIKGIDFDKKVENIQNSQIRNLVKQPKYFAIYKQAYIERYNELTKKNEAQANNVDELEENIEATQNVIDNQEDKKPEEVVTAQAQQDATKDALAKIQGESDNQEEVIEDLQQINLAENDVQEDLSNETIETNSIENISEVSDEETTEENTTVLASESDNQEDSETSEEVKFYTEPVPQTAEELYESIKKVYLSMLKGKKLQAYLNLRSTVEARIQNNKQNVTGQKVKTFMIDQIAATLAERTCVYYDKAKKSNNIAISDRSRSIISCYCNEVLLGKSIFASNWRKSTNEWLAVVLANECNAMLKQYNLEYAVDESTYATITKKYSTQMANFVKELNKYRTKLNAQLEEKAEENI